MTCDFFEQNRKTSAERRFPQGKKGFVFPLNVFVRYCLAFTFFTLVCFSTNSMAEYRDNEHAKRPNEMSEMTLSNIFQSRVREDVQQYAQSMHWQDYREDILVWLPNKAKALPPCDKSVMFTVANQSRPPLGRVHYNIRCESPKWQIRAQAKIKLWLDVWHAKTDIDLDQVIVQGSVYLKNIDISRLNHAFFTTSHSLMNKRSARRVRAGKVIKATGIENAYLVRKGDEVLIRAQTKNFVASMKGIALEDGMLGEKIRIENISSKKIIQAKVVEDGVVETLF